MLKVNAINKNFGGIQAVKNLTFSIEDKKITSIIGPNGAGKTTVFNLLTGIFNIDSGSIHFLDHDISASKTFRIARLGVARTFQNLQIFSNMTVLENIMTGMHLKNRSNIIKSALKLNGKQEVLHREESYSILKVFNLERYADAVAISLPLGIQKQVEICRSLASSPKLMLMDEPAAGLNPYETDELADKIGSILGMGITVLLIEHDMNLVMRISDHIIVLNFGEKIAEGGPAEMQKNPDVIKAYLGE